MYSILENEYLMECTKNALILSLKGTAIIITAIIILSIIGAIINKGLEWLEENKW